MATTKVQRIMTQPNVRARSQPLPPAAAAPSACAALPPRPPHAHEPRSPAPPHQNLIFRFLQSKQRIQIWLFENTEMRIEGRIIVRTPPAPPSPPRARRITPLPPPPPRRASTST